MYTFTGEEDLTNVEGGVRKKMKMMTMAMTGKESEDLAMKEKEVICGFSYLPEPIVQEIIFLLPIKDAIRTSILCKGLRCAWHSMLILDLEHTSSSDRSDDVFLNFIEDCMRRRTPNVSLEKFRVSASFNKPIPFDIRADEAILMAMEKGVRELSIDFRYPSTFNCYYSIPDKVFSADSIKVLELTGFEVNTGNLVLTSPVMEELRLCQGSGIATIQVLSQKLKIAEFVSCQGLEMIETKSLALESFKYIQRKNEQCKINISECKSLKNLVLQGSPVTNQWLSENLSEFRVLESLQLSDCSFLTYMHVLNDRIKSVTLKGCGTLERVVITCQSLETFEYENNTARQCEINILHCKRLKNLALVGASITDSWLRDHMAQFASLESLKLNKCNSLENVKINCQSLETFEYENNPARQCEISIVHSKLLKKLVLVGANITDSWLKEHMAQFGSLESLKLRKCNLLEKVRITDHKTLCKLQLGSCSSLAEIECGARNLGLFTYAGNLMEPPPVILAGNFNAKLSLSSHGQFEELRDFVASFGHCKKLTLLGNQAFLFPKEARKKMLPPLYDIRDLKLDLDNKKTAAVDLVDSALWLAPHPEIVTLDYKGYDQILIKLAYDRTKTKGREEEEEEDSSCCCYLRPIKCWRHNLTRVAIENADIGNAESLMRYFFENGRMLEQVSIDGHTYTQ